MAPKRRNLVRWLIGGVLALAVLAVAVPFAYIHFFSDDAPPPPDATSGTTLPAEAATAQTDGVWTAGAGSQGGYRVKEILFGQDNVAAGSTDDVTGEMEIAGTDVTRAKVTVDLTSVSSGESRRDNQFQGRIMDTASFPTATFELTKPIALGTIPANNKAITASATGELTLHGTTKSVTADVKALRTGNTIRVSGSIPITFADWDIPNPSIGPISTEDHGELEFLVVFTPRG
jgi:polyisoprenoid-binding protein YceI